MAMPTFEVALVVDGKPRRFGDIRPPAAMPDEREDMWFCEPSIYLYPEFPHQKPREYIGCYPGLWPTKEVAERQARVYIEGAELMLRDHMGYKVVHGRDEFEEQLRWAEQQAEQIAQREERRMELEAKRSALKTQLKNLAA